MQTYSYLSPVGESGFEVPTGILSELNIHQLYVDHTAAVANGNGCTICRCDSSLDIEMTTEIVTQCHPFGHFAPANGHVGSSSDLE